MSGPVGYSPGRDPDLPHASRAAPMAESICWRPIEGEATGPGAQQYPIYVRQRALAALHDHFRGSITQGILGFLVGALLEDPTTRERWLELEFIVRLTQPIYGDKTALVISRVWERLQQEVGRTGGHMLGWYHSHPPLGVEIAPGDIEAHEQYFGRPWQIALLLGQTPKGPAGAFYRPSAGLPLGTTPLPFFEIVARDSITAEGRKRTRVTWKNYRPDLRRTSGMVTGVSAVLQALQAPMRPSEAAPASTGGAPLAARPAESSAAVAASAESALPVAATAEPVAVATGAPRLDGRVNTPPRGSGAIKVAATTAPRTAEPPLPPSLRISGAVEKTPEPVSFTPPSAATPALPVAEATSVPLAEPVTALRSADVPPSEPPPALPDKPSPPMYGSPAARGEAPAPEATPPPVRPRPRNPAIDGLPIIEPPPRPSAAVSAPAARPEDAPARSATAAPSAEAAKAPAVPAAVAARELVPETPRRAGAPEPAPAAAPSPAGPRRPGAEGPRPSVQAGGVEILRALPAAQTPTERPAVGAAPLSRPSRDRPTSEVLQELADAITRAARTSGSSPALDVSPPARPGRTTAPRHGPPEVTRSGGAGPRTPAAGSAAVRPARPGVEDPARREAGPVTFTPSPEAATAPPSLGAPRQPAGVTFTPAPGVGATVAVPESPLAAAFAPKAPAESAEPELLPDSLRGGRPVIEPPSALMGSASSERSVDAARPSSAAAAAPRASRLSVRRSFGSGLQAEQGDSGALARLPYVLALFAALATAVWWFAIRPRMGADVRIGSPPPAAAVAESIPPAPAAVPTESLPVAAPVAPPVADSSLTVPVVVAPDAWTPLDQLVDSLDAAIFRYLDRASAFDEGQRDCQLLSAALVSVDRFWVAYNAQRRRLDAPLDSLRALRDQAAYANVEAVDTHFGGSGCPRP